jgi:hypothetical protein
MPATLRATAANGPAPVNSARRRVSESARPRSGDFQAADQAADDRRWHHRFHREPGSQWIRSVFATLFARWQGGGGPRGQRDRKSDRL